MLAPMRPTGSMQTPCNNNPQHEGRQKAKRQVTHGIGGDNLLLVNTYSFPDSLLKPSWNKDRCYEKHAFYAVIIILSVL